MRKIDLGDANLNTAFEQLRNDYDITKNTRFRRNRAGVSSNGTSADYHFRSEAQFTRGIELARDIDRNDIVVGQAVDRLVDNIIQDGFQLDAQTGDVGLDEDLQERWRAWAENADACDLAGVNDFHAMEQMTLRACVVDGDVIHLPIADAGALESCEAHRCRTPSNTKKNVVLGVLLNETTRRREEYWLTKEDLGLYGALSRVSDVRQYPARQRDPLTGRDEKTVIHCYNPRRFSQTRGFTALAPVAMMTEHHDDLQFAQLVKARVAASYAILEELPMSLPSGAAGGQTGERSTEAMSDGTSRTLEGLGPGMKYRSLPGGSLKGFSPNVPNQEFFAHSRLILTFISINLGLPLQLLLLDPTQTNFSGWRGAMDQARLGFRKYQRWLSSSFHGPVYRWKLRQWMSEDRLLEAEYDRLGERLFQHRWNPPRWPYIEPMKDAQAGILRVRNLQTSQRRLCAENGAEWAQIVDENTEDNVYAIRKAKAAAMSINKEFDEGEPVTWRDILTLPTADTISGSLQPGNDTEPETETSAEEVTENDDQQ